MDGGVEGIAGQRDFHDAVVIHFRVADFEVEGEVLAEFFGVFFGGEAELEETEFESSNDAAVEDDFLGGVEDREKASDFEEAVAAFEGEDGGMAMVEAVERGVMDFEAEAVGRRLGGHVDDLAEGVEAEPFEELIALFEGELVEGIVGADFAALRIADCGLRIIGDFRLGRLGSEDCGLG
jgi:hypothetical protein